MNIKIPYLSIILVFIMHAAQAQDSTMIRKQPPKYNFKDRVFFGGNLGLQFGTVTFVDVSPLVGYRITDNVSAGIGVTYQYYRYKDRFYELETNVYGGRVFGRYMFTDYLFAHAEYEYLNLEAFDFFRRRVDVNSVLVGGGYYQRFTSNAGVMAMLLYNFTEDRYTPYTNPIFRIGFNIGF
ncbi:MAG: hypothetical protein L6Q66_03940 [Bacteroidia bacterium]|nr:hypothetical protein [Bacteroidia bacterium]